MKIILLATGETKKLQPLSGRLPSPMIPVADRPVVQHTIDLLARQGHKRILVCLNHQANIIETYLGSGERWGVSLDYTLQRDDLGSAGTLRWARQSLTETFLVLPADSLIDMDLSMLLAQHRQQGNIATLVTHKTDQHAYQPITLDDHGILTRTENGDSAWCDTGIYVFEPEVLDFIPDHVPFDIHSQLIPALISAGKQVRAYKMHGYWNPLVNFVDYQKAQQTFLHSQPNNYGSNRVRLQYLRIGKRPVKDGIWIGKNSVIHPGARLHPPVYIGENCWIGPGVEIGPDAVLGQNVIVDEDATVLNSTILDYTYLGRLVKVDNRVIRQAQVIDILSGAMVQIVDQFLIGSSHRTIEDSLFARFFNMFIGLVTLLISLPISLPTALLAWIMHGHIFAPVTRLRPVRWGTGSAATGSTDERFAPFQLLQFATLNKKGQETRLTGWMERWAVYRLPELWNVIRGDLQLVGVAPLCPEELSGFTEAWQQPIATCQPGFTGLWFVQTQAGSSPIEQQLADAFYCATRSWKVDLGIIRKTPAAWFRRARARINSQYQTIEQTKVSSF